MSKGTELESGFVLDPDNPLITEQLILEDHLLNGTGLGKWTRDGNAWERASLLMAISQRIAQQRGTIHPDHLEMMFRGAIQALRNGPAFAPGEIGRCFERLAMHGEFLEVINHYGANVVLQLHKSKVLNQDDRDRLLTLAYLCWDQGRTYLGEKLATAIGTSLARYWWSAAFSETAARLNLLKVAGKYSNRVMNPARQKELSEAADACGAQVLDLVLHVVLNELAVTTESLDPNEGKLLTLVLRELVRMQGDGAVTLLRKFAEAGVRPVESGMTSQRLTLSALELLGDLDGETAIHALIALKNKIRTQKFQKVASASLERIATRRGVTAEDLLAFVPDFGVSPLGTKEYVRGSVRAELSVESGGKVELEWYDGEQRSSSPPSRLPDSTRKWIKEVKAEEAEIRRAVSAQRRILDDLLLPKKVFPYPSWRTRFWDHPLVRKLSEGCIWAVDGHLGMPRGDHWIAADGTPFEVRDTSEIELWHPVRMGLAAIDVWRDFIMQHELRQPIRQAFREIYLLTDAERETRTYSLRYARHCVRAAQVSALARERGWKLSRSRDPYNPVAVRELPEFDLRAELPLTSVGMFSTWSSAVFETSETRFVTMRGEALALEDVPPVVFSEIFRDVDLFVSVANVGNETTQDALRRMAATHDEWGFGELTVRSETRREALQRLLPKLVIRDRLRIEGRFLHVQGNQRQYRIHLGSGNILMSPRDQYLCIVPSQKERATTVRLPFDDDAMLSLILSKATLLVNDDKITDRVIRQQIDRPI